VKELIEKLPYGPDFLFVDEILSIDDNSMSGCYTYRPDALFYRDHFPAKPVTPGVILIETMAQIGLLCFGFYLQKDKKDDMPAFAFTSSNIEFFKIVLPGEKVIVLSEKIFFRLGKLKCRVEMKNIADETIAKGEMSGMIIKSTKLIQ
jgi:3-hydroxyacyl-[acyl-carrier-protein] dehydratase